MNCNCFLFYLPGLLLVFAYDHISYDKIATQSNTYDGTGTKHDAKNAFDGNTATCMRTKVIGKNSPDKTVWWKVDLGGVYNIFSISILFKSYEGYEVRQRGRFAGFSLYISNTGVIQGSSLCYKNGPRLPPLNFSTICSESGRYVIFYNERLDGIIYTEGYEITNVNTELCEVTVQGCSNASVYGSNCDTPCPVNCKDSTCHIQSGTCFTCKPGWTGIYCNTKCVEGWYGSNCSQHCSIHCRGTLCNHITGVCDRGCDTGWSGRFCDKDECSSGQFGLDCIEHCIGHCINNEPCDHVSGVCPSGCQDGFFGRHCNNSCTNGYFGPNCSHVCSSNCRTYTCQHIDGSCSCASGWTGHNCTTECILSYGENCQHRCNVNCINETCDRFNGSCLYGCKYGKQCDKVSLDTANDAKVSLSLSDNSPVIVGGTVGTCVIIIIGVVMALFFIRLKRKSTMMANRQSFILEEKTLRTTKPKTEQSSLSKESTYALPEKTKRGPPTNKNISVRNMKAQIANMSLNENAGFKSEYHDIPRGELHPCLEGKKQENKVKNRYTTIFPYDHSRVILKTVTSNNEGYINANYIEASTS